MQGPFWIRNRRKSQPAISRLTICRKSIVGPSTLSGLPRAWFCQSAAMMRGWSCQQGWSVVRSKWVPQAAQSIEVEWFSLLVEPLQRN